ncbi:MAG: substrate-binding domain-containing protein [Anaerolineae bacterium]|nr:substrate-binding domain-containing protein [Anaerolineae bacterium]
MKKRLSVLFAVLTVLVFALSACQPAAPATEAPAAPATEAPAAPATEAPAAPATEAPAKPAAKYGLFMSHMTNAFTIELSDAVKSKAQELGVELTVYDGEHDPAKQVSQVETAVTQGISCIVIEPASVDGLVPAIENATKSGVPVVVVNQAISKPEVASSFVGVSNVDGGILEMKTAAEALGGKGNVAFLLGPMGSDAQLGRTKGYYEVLKDYPDIKVVFEQTANWKTDEALTVVENWLQTGTQIDAIVANNDGMALGALKAVEDAKLLDKIKIYGLDATPDALAAVKEGKLAATISQNTTAQGLTAMETCYKIVQGEQVEKEILLNFVLITKDNVDEFIK